MTTIETIAASRCPRCATLVAPPATYCPHHPVAMKSVSLPGIGDVVTFTTLHTPPQGFPGTRSHIDLVSPSFLPWPDLEGTAKRTKANPSKRRRRAKR